MTSVIGIGIGIGIISVIEVNQENYMAIWVGTFQVIYDKLYLRNQILISLYNVGISINDSNVVNRPWLEELFCMLQSLKSYKEKNTTLKYLD